MENHQIQSITEVLMDFLRDTGMDKPLMEQEVMNKWAEVVGPMAANLTQRLEVKNGVLYAYVRSAALKAELFQCRFDIVRRLNEAVKGNVIRDIRLLG